MKKIFNLFYKSLLIFLPLFCIVWAFIFYFLPYKTCTEYILSALQKNELRLYWERDIMPFSRYKILPYMVMLAGIICSFFSFYFFGKGDMVFVFFVDFFSKLKTKIRDFISDFTFQNPWLKVLTVLLFALFLIRSLYNIQAYEIQYDEAWTYTNFVNKGILVSALSPHNNHILYTIFAAILNYIPFLEAKYIMRLPVLIAAIFSMLLWLYYWRKKWGWENAIYSTIILVCSAPFFIYGLYGRAYMLSFLMAILQLASMSKLYLEKTETKDSFYVLFLLLAQVLGVYALPTYIYIVVLAQIGILFFTNRYKLWFKTNVFSIAILLVLYTPFLITNGANILLHAAEKTSNYTWQMHFTLFHKLSDWLLFGADYLYLGYFTIALIIYALYIVYKTPNPIIKYWAFCAGTLLLLPLLLFFYQPLRVWSLQVIAYTFLLSFFIFKTKAKLPFSKKIFPVFLLIAVIFQHCFLYAHYEINWAKNLDSEGKKIAALLQAKGVKEIYTYSRYDKPLLEYYYAIENKPVKIYMPYRESKDYRTFSSQKFEALLLDIEDYKPTRSDSLIIKEKKYQLLYKNERLEVYLSDEIF